MDVDTPNEDQSENDLNGRKNRIQMFKNILNYYQGRSLSLDFILASKQPSVNVTPEMKTHEALCKDIQGLYDDITLIQSIRNCLKLINYSLASTEVMRVNNNSHREIINKIEGIIYFSKAIMKLYSECCNQLDIIEKMRSYSTVMSEYMKNLHELREMEKNGNDEESKEMEKAELQVYKINLMRTMKSILIGYISLNCPNLIRNVQQFKNSLRRDLTLDDFHDTWDVGYCFMFLKLGNHFIQNDTNVEKALRFQRDISRCLAQYEEVFKDLTKNSKQLLITDFITTSHNVNISASNIESAQITSSDEG